ncbi:glutamate--cysteine ligase [Roseofilum sp. BLCC_M91]|uniref:Glutamate--cysteine ligase n=1 Tax=Roseofilum halophilum BLCC-M91 TaxID=3022259 RepID=A0ABT7BFU8_9CYAN|nr:glutamate--cysteine ligase [Roseofilum halophilum]MDJ1178031.1 glutamate--cysteine ligase [Roseofilum halophilum BLCC-M91]
MLLSKGFEIEMYTGTPQGEIVGLSDRIVADLNGFVREPDSRNVEYTTAPLCRYESLLCELVVPRQRLRQYLKGLGNYTLIPGSTLSLGGGDRFYRSDPKNPYHEYIEKTYGTKVVTASIHINMGIADPEVLMRACRLVRLEAPLYLALSASSPFFNGQVTGSHSTRWQVFPQTPEFVPLFESHRHYIDWTQEQLAKGTMQNVRHLWSSVRPNGDRRPYNLNRLELRICDLVTDPIALLAITALLEARLWQAIADPGLDPLLLCDDPQGLVDLTATNEEAVAQSSLEARLTHWQDGRSILAREWIEELYDRVWPFAKQKGFSCFLSPVKKILRQGNESLRWLQEYQRYGNLEQVMQQAIAHTEQEEQEMADHLCHPLVA